METIIAIAIAAVFIFVIFITMIARYKKCPSNKILVKYGRVGKNKTAQPIHGGATFVWPLIQAYQFLDLTPMTTEINLKNALSNQNIRIDIPSRFTFGVSTKTEIMINAAERLLGLNINDIESLAQDIIFGQLRATVATMEIEAINADREAFEQKVMDNVESELNKIGLNLINVNITDINDESGYIEALGKKAASEAINKAKVEVAQQDRNGETGAKVAEQEKRIAIAESEAKAVTGENESQVKREESNADRREKVAEAERKAETAEKTKAAAAQKAAYIAETEAEQEKRKLEQTKKEIEVVVAADVEKQKVEKEAEAEKIKLEKAGEGKGLAIQKEMEGQAAGILAILEKKAEGFKAIVDSAGGDAKQAATLLIIEQLPKIVEAQAAAIANIKFDRIVVMDGAGGKNSSSTTANWLSSITKALPGLHEFAEMAGINLPDILGNLIPGPEKADEGRKKEKIEEETEE